MWFTDIHGNLVNFDHVVRLFVAGSSSKNELKAKLISGEDAIFYRGEYEDCKMARSYVRDRISLNSGIIVQEQIEIEYTAGTSAATRPNSSARPRA